MIKYPCMVPMGCWHNVILLFILVSLVTLSLSNQNSEYLLMPVTTLHLKDCRDSLTAGLWWVYCWVTQPVSSDVPKKILPLLICCEADWEVAMLRNESLTSISKMDSQQFEPLMVLCLSLKRWIHFDWDFIGVPCVLYFTCVLHCR